MAKEMMIVFVYNTVKCKNEEDDPAESVMYFHPAWVSLPQRLLLAGQLMGVNQFLMTTFSSPCLISLRGGKFVLKKLGQYILAVGTDRNIQDWILQRRANTLESLLKFFHCDIETISSSLNNDKTKFTEKLYQMFETYLPILQYSSSLFASSPSLKLPRSASHVFLEATQILQNCQEINGIMGGALFYNNKVVASQLCAEITKQLVITDPYRIKAPAERISTMYHLPVGVQLLYVYIEQRQINKMINSANLERSYSSHLAACIKKVLHNKKNFKNNSKEQPLLLKRDISRIFTVPEEGELDSINDNSFSNFPALQSESSTIIKKEERKNESIKQQIPITPSVCCTPLKDVQRILHGTAVSICSTTDEAEMWTEANKSDERRKNSNDIPDIVKEALLCKKLNKLKNAMSRERFVKFEDNNKKSLSLNDIKHYANQELWETDLSELNRNFDYKSHTARRKTMPNKRYFNTITDPNFPVFRSDGVQVTHSLYNQYIASHYQELNQDQEASISDPKPSKSITNGPTEAEKLKKDLSGKQKLKVSTNVKLQNSKQEVHRSSLSLPLKPLNVLDSDERSKSTSNCNSGFETQRKLDGLQLTPLMSKLSLIVDEKKSSGFSVRETTPNECRDFSGYSVVNNLFKNKLDSSTVNNDNNEDIDVDWMNAIKNKSSVEKTELFLCGHQNMVLMLLLENGMCSDPELIHSLWRTCINNLGKLEICLQQCLDPLPITNNKELYSVISVNSEWDTTYRSGLWGVTELDILSTLHNRFTNKNNLTDIIVRSDDAVVYGNQCGNIEVYYQQTLSSGTYGGLPTPADLMGIIPLKAKRRIERDHDIILL